MYIKIKNSFLGQTFVKNVSLKIVLIIIFSMFVGEVYATENTIPELLVVAKSLLKDIGKTPCGILKQLEKKSLVHITVYADLNKPDKPIGLIYSKNDKILKPVVLIVKLKNDIVPDKVITYQGPRDWLNKIRKDIVVTKIDSEIYMVNLKLILEPEILGLKNTLSFGIATQTLCSVPFGEPQEKISDLKVYGIPFSEFRELNEKILKNQTIIVGSVFVNLLEKGQDHPEVGANQIVYKFYKNRVADISFDIKERDVLVVKKGLLEISEPVIGQGQMPDNAKEQIKKQKAISKKFGTQLEEKFKKRFEKPIVHEDLRRFKLDSGKIVYALIKKGAFDLKRLNFRVMAPPVKKFYNNGKFKSNKSINEYEDQFRSFVQALGTRKPYSNSHLKDRLSKCQDFIKGLWGDMSPDLYVAPCSR